MNQIYRILIVDDNSNIHDDFSKILVPNKKCELEKLDTLFFGEAKSNGSERHSVKYELDHALQGDEAVKLVQKAKNDAKPYALAFVDVRMPPGCNGIETTERIKQIDPDIQTVICSAYSDHSWETIAERFGQTDSLLILRKPFEQIEVLQLASALTKKWSTQKELVAQMSSLADQVTATNDDKKLLEDQLRQAQKMEAVGRLAGGIAHDFNNLLTINLGYANLLLRKKTLDQDTREYVEQIKDASERAAALTAQLLAFSRKEVYHNEPLHLNEVILATKKMLGRTLGEDIILDVKLHDDELKIMGDRGHLTQVLLNLAVNARDAMPKGGSLSIETEPIYLDDSYCKLHVGVSSGHYLCLSVSDTGLGISPDIRDKIFEPFFTTKESGKGTGLGLSTVYGIVKQANGHIWVYSEVGKGTCFRIYFPIASMKQSSKIERSKKTNHRGSGTVLVVEDEIRLRELAHHVLKAAGYDVIEACHGREAIEKLSVHQDIKLVVSDVVMPQLGGAELMKHLKLTAPKLPILLMSGYTENTAVHHGVEIGETEFIQKPFSPDALLEKVGNLIKN